MDTMVNRRPLTHRKPTHTTNRRPTLINSVAEMRRCMVTAIMDQVWKARGRASIAAAASYP
jgi:hypothetical protein